MDSSDQPAALAVAQWLTTDEAADWFAWLAEIDRTAISTVTRLRKELDAGQAQALLQQLDLRRRGAKKFDLAEKMFFTDVGLQQSTDEQISAYKASRFPEGKPLADLCCGIGGDLIALAKRGPTTAVDASAEHLCFAEANVSAHGAKLAGTQCGLAEEAPLESFAAWHIDPDRRHDNRRTIRLESFQPSLEHLEEMLRQNRNAALKLAPASSIPERWQEEGTCEWISNHRECKQLVVWLGDLSAGNALRRVTRIEPDGQVDSYEALPAGLSSAEEVGRYLFDPDPALVAAGLVDALGKQLNLARVSAKSHYLTGDQPVKHPLLQGFEVIEQEKIDPKRLKKAVAQADWGTLELKQRGMELKLETLRKQLKPRGAGEGTILFTPTTAGNRAILAKRWKKIASSPREEAI